MPARIAELQVSLAREQLADLINRVAYAGETIYLTRRGRRMAALVPVPSMLPQPTASTSADATTPDGAALDGAQVAVSETIAVAEAPPAGATASERD
ncbi:prevent-host-death family protein [Kineococcus xinjiangensis]|uniref:Prevent-host-death family protein n=1 Tax=Kineococcus xinjiangensis TaxID=512762 RepID=A0A2S6IEL6_9ACTN|nr:type II toxin-antitoxin system prevent-host-death family antitoxin [Kineococcus xinjiangensis]PPK92664.1 prevent-host-death family protein [Kineococcus xinjiangensis]